VWILVLVTIALAPYLVARVRRPRGRDARGGA